ncbi:MAG: hypothetical protein R3E12_05770 [Candidatus Eisenbacteria bacterium]
MIAPKICAEGVEEGIEAIGLASTTAPQRDHRVGAGPLVQAGEEIVLRVAIWKVAEPPDPHIQAAWLGRAPASAVHQDLGGLFGRAAEMISVTARSLLAG